MDEGVNGTSSEKSVKKRFNMGGVLQNYEVYDNV